MVVLINKIAGIGAIISHSVIIYLLIVIEKNRKLHLNDVQESVDDSEIGTSTEEATKFEKKRKHLKLLLVASVLSIIFSIINIWVR